MSRPLAVSMRPRRLSELIGQETLVEVIRKKQETRDPAAWMFTGPTGTGKTTVARIIAVSLQCKHQKQFGEPCDECLAARSSFSIREINASEVSGVEEIGAVAQASVYLPAPPSKRSVFILDEAQRLSPSSQNLLLKYFEDAAKTTVWIICTTEQFKILETLRRRCAVLELKLLQAKEIEQLVMKGLAEVKSKKIAKPLVQALWAAKIQSPALILNAVENYQAGMKSKEAVKNLTTSLDATAICRALEKGDWSTIRDEVKEATSDDLRGIRASVAGYLKGALISMIPGPRAKEMASAIEMVSRVDSCTDVTQGPATVAALYNLCHLFKGPEEDRDDLYDKGDTL